MKKIPIILCALLISLSCTSCNQNSGNTGTEETSVESSTIAPVEEAYTLWGSTTDPTYLFELHCVKLDDNFQFAYRQHPDWTELRRYSVDENCEYIVCGKTVTKGEFNDELYKRCSCMDEDDAIYRNKRTDDIYECYRDTTVGQILYPDEYEPEIKEYLESSGILTFIGVDDNNFGNGLEGHIYKLEIAEDVNEEDDYSDEQ